MANLTSTMQRERARLPRLEAGDHLDQPTFHQRYEAMPPGFKAELIGGMVYVPSPLLPVHGESHAVVMHWLGEYSLATPGTVVRDNATVILGPESEPQPDAMMVIDPTLGGSTNLGADGYPVGAPELIVEVASSSEAYDLHEKLQDYEQAGVQEYLVALLRNRENRWHSLASGRYERLAPVAGVLHSRVFPGLCLNVEALLELDRASVLRTLREGLASSEHASFVDELNRRRP